MKCSKYVQQFQRTSETTFAKSLPLLSAAITPDVHSTNFCGLVTLVATYLIKSALRGDAHKGSAANGECARCFVENGCEEELMAGGRHFCIHFRHTLKPSGGE
jgi:hypothetical protein